MTKVINFQQKLGLFSQHWSPKVIAQMNDYQFKLAKLKGEFVWHQHDDTDEVFICLQGELTIELEASHITLGPGEMTVIEKGVKHKPVATEECKVLIVEPCGVVNTGEAGGELTAENDVWI